MSWPPDFLDEEAVNQSAALYYVLYLLHEFLLVKSEDWKKLVRVNKLWKLLHFDCGPPLQELLIKIRVCQTRQQISNSAQTLQTTTYIQGSFIAFSFQILIRHRN